MKNSTMFIRGQVWYWEDPMFGRKENNVNVSIGEATIRYNRYCIIIQDTETISNNSVLVIPCSSHNNTPHDVKIPLAHTFKENFTYAKTRAMFPVHPKFLNRYICTLPNEVMSQIDAELLKLLLPAVTTNMDSDSILSNFGIDMNKSMDIQINTRDIEVDIRAFIKDHIVRGKDVDVVKPRELKAAFDQYCTINKIPIVEDIVEFLDSFTYIVNGTSYNLSDRFNYNSMEFKGMKINNNFKLSIEVTAETIKSDVSQKTNKWDDESIIEFLRFYKDHTLDDVYKQYNLKPATAKVYWNRWNTKLEEATIEEIPVEEKVEIPVPTTADAQRSVSKIANMIRNTLIDDELYGCLGDVTINGDDIIGADEFYDRLGSTIYFSLIDFLGITHHDWKHCYIPRVTPKSPYITTWHFVDKCYHDRRISMEENGIKMVELYREYYGDINTGIDKDWIDKLKTKIGNKFDMESDYVDFICERVEEVFCRIS